MTAVAQGPVRTVEGLAPGGLSDLAEDLDELAFVAGSAAERLAEEASMPGDPVVLATLSELRRDAAEAATLAHRAARNPPGVETVERLAAARLRIVERVRSRLGVAAALVTATDWQSPSFGHSLQPAAGRQAGLVTPHVNDYKRDRHLDAEAYEHAYVREYVRAGDARALMTSCGMAAFTTILGFLLCEGRLRHRYVVIGRGLYHETKELLYGAIPTQVVEMDELVPASVELAIEKFEPAALFFDSLSNTSRAPVIDLERLLAVLARRAEETYLVVDATGTTVAGLPPALRSPPGSVRLLLFESLLKYCQLGLDRTNAGVVVARGEDAERLSCYREHLGTNVPDVAVHALPRPSREMLLRRLRRLERNALIVAERLELALEASGLGAAAEVVHPLLPSHPSQAVASGLRFAGSCLALRPAPALDGPSWRLGFVAAALRAARRRGVSLVAGSSFGFDATRIYVTAATAEHGEPFVRISVGTEHRLAVHQLAEALADALTEAVLDAGAG